VRRHAASGTPAQLRERFDMYQKAGLDEIVIAGVRDASQVSGILHIKGS